MGVMDLITLYKIINVRYVAKHFKLQIKNNRFWL